MDAATKIERPKRTLNEIVEAYRAVIWAIDDAEGEVTDDIAVELDACEAELTAKVDACLWIATQAEAQAAALKERADAIAAQAKAVAERGTRIVAYVQGAMTAAGLDKLATRNFPSVRIQKNNPAVDIADEAAFIAAHEKDGLVKYEPKIDRKAALDLLKAGTAVVGASIKGATYHLRFK
jgi:hypothetical protein